ncbi:MAG: hypothetical protein LQ339_005060 [Xanthoria mediterranea]|nr:MAG: hypothetical protein LQ339_005060 [Xanthoria mediterranea]
MFYDLNIPYTTNHAELQRTLAFVAELGFNTIAISVSLSGKLPTDLVRAYNSNIPTKPENPHQLIPIQFQTSPIPSPLPFSIPPTLHILTRCTLTLSDPSQNHRLTSLTSLYDLLAIRPTSEKTLQQTCLSLPTIEIISLDCTIRYPFYFRQSTLLAAIDRGIRFEICYAQGILGAGEARRNLISNATQLVRATRGKGIVLSSEAQRALACRGPWDVVNLGIGWGLEKERAVEALQREARGVVVGAEMRRRSYRGVVDVVYGGEKPVVEEKGKGKNLGGKGKEMVGKGGKRKAGDSVDAGEVVVDEAEKPPSKRELKRRAAKARKAVATGKADGSDNAVEESTKTKENGDVAMANSKDQG